MPVKVVKSKARSRINCHYAPWCHALALSILSLANGCTTSAPGFPPIKDRLCTNLSQEQNLPLVAVRAQTILSEYRTANQSAYRDAIRKLSEIKKQEREKRSKTDKRLHVERGDRFPSISLKNSMADTTILRLDPPLRRHDVVSIEKIAISPHKKRVAVIAKTRFSKTPLLLILDSRGVVLRAARASVYDVLWADDYNLVVSTGTLQPDQIHLIRGDDDVIELKKSTYPGQPLLLSKSRSGTLFSIEERSINQSTLSVYDSKTPQTKLLELQAPLAGSRCEHFKNQVVCLSFSNNTHGDIVAFLAEHPVDQTIIRRGTEYSILQGIDADEGTLVVFTREKDRSVLYAYQSLSMEPQRILSPTPTSSFSMGPKLSPSEPITIAIRAPLFPTTFKPIGALSSPSAQHPTPAFCSACQEEVMYAETPDGTLVPISLITPPSPKGLLIKAYGSYGVPLTPEYSRENRALLESGIALAFVHVRGGGDRGHTWHIEGSGTKKLQGMRDLITATKEVQNYLKLKPEETIGTGTSAGGWLFIRTALEQPTLFSALILEAPLIEPSLRSLNPAAFDIDHLEWSSPDEDSYSTDLQKHTSAPLFPRVLASLPLRDSVIPTSKTLLWLNQLACIKTRHLQDFIYIDRGGEHSRASSAEAQATWEALKNTFIHSVLDEAIIESDSTNPIRGEG